MQELIRYRLIYFDMQLDFWIVTYKLINRYCHSCFFMGLSYCIFPLILSWFNSGTCTVQTMQKDFNSTSTLPRFCTHSLRICTVVKFYSHTLQIHSNAVLPSPRAPLVKTMIKLIVNNKSWFFHFHFGFGSLINVNQPSYPHIRRIMLVR